MPQKGLPTVTAIIVAAGASRRMGFDKLSYCLPDGRTVLETSCALFAAHPAVDELVLVAGGNQTAARLLEHGILAKWPEAPVRIVPCSGLCSFYAQDQGIIITY